MSNVFADALNSGPKSKKERYANLFEQLKGERQGGGFDSTWREIAAVMAPKRVRFSTGDRNKGDRRDKAILDSTARFAARTLASGLHAGLTSPARPWMKLTTPDPQLAEYGPVKNWLHVVTTRMRTVFQQTNLYNALPLAYFDMGVFGTAALALLEDSRDLFRAYHYAVGTYAVALDERGKVSTFAREYELSVRQVVKSFGVKPGATSIDWSNISNTVKRAWELGNYEQAATITWIVQPNLEAKAGSPWSKDMPFVSCHFERDAQDAADREKFLKESGFRTFPIMAPRWEVTDNDSYGTDCPGMMVTGDTNQLQLEQRKKGQLLAKAVDPPLKGPSSLRTQKVSSIAGDITYDDSRDGKGLSPIHEVRLEGFQHLTADIQDVRQMIRRGFYEDLFLMLANSDPYRGDQPITAREVEERHEEKLLALGPVLERTNDELLDPLVDRTYALMELHGLVPEPPDELDGVALKVEYISILAQAQKLVSVAAQDRFLTSTIPLAEVFPEVRHKVNVFGIVDSYQDALGVDPHLVRSNEEAQQLFDQEQEAARGMAAAEQAKQLAGAMAQAGAKPVAPDSALDRLAQGVAG
jgi:hypothetical protein